MSLDNFTYRIFENYPKVLRNILSRNECQLVRLNMTGNSLGDNGLQILCNGVEVRTYVLQFLSDPESFFGIFFMSFCDQKNAIYHYHYLFYFTVNRRNHGILHIWMYGQTV